MRNIKLTIEYDGSRYQGWQRLGKNESGQTIHQKLSEVLEKFIGKPVEINCGHRTETGVHAYAQVANFKTDAAHSCREIKQYLNRYLPMDIAVLSAEDMPERFHASLNAVSRTYTYHILIGDVPSVFDRKYAYYAFQKPDITLMKQAAACFVGKHDFFNLSSGKKKKGTEKEIYEIDIYGNSSEILITICANDFLHNMARLIIGFLLDVGLGKRRLEDVNLLLNSTSTLEFTVIPADPKGLFLQEITYK